MERHVGVFSVDFGSRGGEDEFALFAGCFEDALCAVDVGFDSADGAFDDELDTDGSSEVDDDVGVVNELREQLKVFDVVEVVFQVWPEALRWRMLSMLPVERLSSNTTFSPRSSNRSVR